MNRSLCAFCSLPRLFTLPPVHKSSHTPFSLPGFPGWISLYFLVCESFPVRKSLILGTWIAPCAHFTHSLGFSLSPVHKSPHASSRALVSWTGISTFFLVCKFVPCTWIVACVHFTRLLVLLTFKCLLITTLVFLFAIRVLLRFAVFLYRVSWLLTLFVFLLQRWKKCYYPSRAKVGGSHKKTWYEVKPFGWACLRKIAITKLFFYPFKIKNQAAWALIITMNVAFVAILIKKNSTETCLATFTKSWIEF